MPKITFLPQNITVETPQAASLSEAARLAGVSVETPCGGKGVCRKCLVKILSGKVNIKQNSYKNTKENHVLICQTYVADEPVCVEILSGLYDEQGQFDDTDNISNYFSGQIDSMVKRKKIIVAKPTPSDGLSDLDRLKTAVKAAITCREVAIPLSVLKTLPQKLREENSGDIEIIYYTDNDTVKIIYIHNSESDKPIYGIAADIGTTTVTLWLADLENGKIIARRTNYNAQIECGLDVISRINYAQKYLPELQERILRTVNDLIEIVTAENNIGADRIFGASITGNTVMIHLLLGIYPEYIRLSPYTPAVYKVPIFSAGEIGFNINSCAPVAIAPAVGSYVGGDIIAGALCTSLASDSAEMALFLDIGTNGEILLGNNEFIMGCACSAGPAFEGGGIEHGMRASKGAIEDFKFDQTGKITIKTIEDSPPTGICGSGIIAVISEMFRFGVIDAAGRFTDKIPERVKRDTKPVKFYITEDITLSEADIDNFIRAKGAVFSAYRTLLNSIGLAFGDIDRVYIAGSFGKYLNIEQAKTIGFLPDIPNEKFTYLGNTSILGAYMILLSEEQHKKEYEIAGRITYIDLSNEPGYMDEYLAALFLPHTDMSLFD